MMKRKIKGKREGGSEEGGIQKKKKIDKKRKNWQRKLVGKISDDLKNFLVPFNLYSFYFLSARRSRIKAINKNNYQKQSR